MVEGPPLGKARRYVLQHHARAVKLRAEQLFPGLIAAFTVTITVTETLILAAMVLGAMIWMG